MGNQFEGSHQTPTGMLETFADLKRTIMRLSEDITSFKQSIGDSVEKLEIEIRQQSEEIKQIGKRFKTQPPLDVASEVNRMDSQISAISKAYIYCPYVTKYLDIQLNDVLVLN